MRRMTLVATVVLGLLLPAQASAAAFGFLGKWGGRGSAATQLNAPTGVAVDTGPFARVVDSGNLRLEKFDGGVGGFMSTSGFGVNGTAGVFQTCESGCRQGQAGSGAGQLGAGATGIAVTPGSSTPTTYVVDTANNRINTYNTAGSPTGSFGAGQLLHPTGIAVTPSDAAIYVVDQAHRRIVQFDNLHAFVRTWGKDVGGAGVNTCTSLPCSPGTSGSHGDEFETPQDVAVDSTGNVYVTDSLKEVVQKFDANGVFLRSWGGGVICGVAASCTEEPIGTGEGTFHSPIGIAVNGSSVYVVDSVNNRVQQFNTDGAFLSTFGWGVADGASAFETCTAACHAGLAGAGNGQFRAPTRVALDPGANVYVSDSGNDRIQKFGSLHIAHNGSELATLLALCSVYDTILLDPGTYALTSEKQVGGFTLAPNPAKGGNARNIKIDAGGNSGVFFVSNNLHASLRGMTITGGVAHGEGGGIQVDGDAFLYLQDSAVRGNQTKLATLSTLRGGGIFNGGELHATNVTVSGNASHGDDTGGHDGVGGGIATGILGATPAATPETYLINVTISGNSATQAAGAANASAFGGGLYNADPTITTVYSSTIANNSVVGARPGGGGGNVYDRRPLFDGTYLTNTIVAHGSSNRVGTENCGVGSGMMVSHGGNLEDRNQCGFNHTGDQVNKTVVLGPLANNGGPLDTRSIPPGSPAQDHALGAPCNVFDERGVPRKTAANPLCDVGAFEQPRPPKPKCALVVRSSKVKAPKPRTLRLKATCNRAATLKLTGTITAKPKAKKGKKKPKAKTFKLSASGKATQARRAVTLTVRVPTSAIELLQKGAKESATFRLRASNAGGATTATAQIKKLTLKT